MLKVKVMASGSSGNCTVLEGSARIMLDAGIPMKQILTSLNYKLPEYVLITHEHGDHAQKSTVKNLLERGVEVYMTAGTKDALKLENRYNLHLFSPNLEMKPIKLGDYKFTALQAVHDAAEPAVFKIESDTEKILYATDTRQVPHWHSNRPYTKILVESNFLENELLESKTIDEGQRKRIFENHLSIERTVESFEYWKRNNLLDALQEVHLIHLSKRHGNAARFIQAVKEVVGEIEVYAH